ncbi:Spy/CpxP family protein refolding chaperone [Legionella cardiaca]|uniref:Spy/CpxP family protein refolding chaperone n=1 Tax=Legionella cardiaca TaxID=1071983 RepID=A0ABY8ASL5_9GAMM|nr:Spy/CpxP family protein refolding chaperone [Legionella cardiaca]WED42490.1 Spy/CpxP family protein refolding chaperone [Legionella cardiaca]
MYKKLVGLLLLTLSFSFSQALFADDSVCRQGLKKMVESLKLTDDQKGKIQPILDQLKSTMKENGSQMEGLESQMREQANSSTMNQDTVNGLVDKKTALIGNMMKARLNAENQIFAILTPEQKTKLQAMMKTAEKKMADAFKSCHDVD